MKMIPLIMNAHHLGLPRRFGKIAKRIEKLGDVDEHPIGIVGRIKTGLF